MNLFCSLINKHYSGLFQHSSSSLVNNYLTYMYTYVSFIHCLITKDLLGEIWS